MHSVAVTDAHPLIWYAAGQRRRLGRNARQLFDAAASGRAAIHVPVLALVEVGEAARAGKVFFADGFDAWARRLLRSPTFLPIELTADIVLQGEALYSIPERTDRLIAATALHMGYPLITRDPAIAAAGVEIVW